MNYKIKKIVGILLSVSILLSINSCQKQNNQPKIDDALHDSSSILNTSNLNDSDLESWLMPLLSEYLAEETPLVKPPVTTPPITAQKGAINERYALPITNSDNQQVMISTTTYGYSTSLISSSATEAIFDLNRDETLNTQTNIVEVNVKTTSGKTVGMGKYDISSIFNDAQVVVSLRDLSTTQFEMALSGTKFSIKDYTTNNTSALINIGNQSTETALAEIERLIQAAKPTSLITQAGASFTVNSGPDFAYKTDGHSWRVRSLDPACNILPTLTNYKNDDNWSKITDLRTQTNASQAHAQGYDGSGITIFMLDSGVGVDDEFDCAATLQKEQHGTHIFNILSTLAPNAEIISRKIFGSTGTATTDNLFNSFKISEVLAEIEKEHLSKGKKVIVNMSFSSPAHPEHGPDTNLWGDINELNKRYSNNLLIVASAGNHGLDSEYSNKIFYPSGFSRSWITKLGAGTTTITPFDNILSVGSAGLKGNQNYPAHYNPLHTGIDLLGYGVNVCANKSCISGGLVGSSFSVPIVSAIAALNWQQCNNLKPGELIAQLKSTGHILEDTSLKLVSANPNYDCGNNRSGVIIGVSGSLEKDESVIDVITDLNKNIFVLGLVNTGEMYLTKFNSTGNEIWNHTTSTAVLGRALTIDKGGNLYVTGRINRGEIFVEKYDNNGNILWFKEIGSGTGTSIDVDSDDNIIVVGQASASDLFNNSNGNNGTSFVTKYNPQGKQLWAKQFDTGKNLAWVDSVTLDSFDNIYVICGTYSNYCIHKYDSNGKSIWTQYFSSDEEGLYFDIPGNDRASMDSNNNLYITGFTRGSLPDNNSNGGIDAFIAKYDQNGNQIWIKQFGSVYAEEGIAIITTNTGRSYLVGLTYSNPNSATSVGRFLTAFDTNGNQLWRQEYNFRINALALEDEIILAGALYTFNQELNRGNWDIFIAQVNQ